MNEKNRPVDVLTPIAASTLLGRSSEAVRTAARKGFVQTAFTLCVTGKEVNLIRLDSALAYWGKPTGRGFPDLDGEIERMRGLGVTISVDQVASYSILHPYPVAEFGDGELLRLSGE